ncbi:MAG: DNA polymerase IV [Halieaceae bacterium]
MTNTIRKIIHVDADSFYASVELREDPSLAGQPIAVGGRSERRGVIAAASYEARKFGVRSAMPSSRAISLCPQLVILPPRFELYRDVSAEFHRIFADHTALIEPLSLDEAYLDVTHAEHCQGSATLIAREIRERVRKELSLTVSAGVAPNKFLAKVASDWDKPDGLFTIAPEQVAAFVQGLPVDRINGVGKVTAAKLGTMGVQTCGDLQKIPLATLIKRFGKYGKRLSEVAAGRDDRPVQSSRVRKSISVERTFAEDMTAMAAMEEAVDDLVLELHTRFARIAGRYAPIKRVIKIKYQDFTQTTLEEPLPADGKPWNDAADFRRLLAAAWPRGAKPVRLLGAGLRLRPLADEEESQLSLFESQA